MVEADAPDGALTLGLLDIGGETIAIDVSSLAEVAHIEKLNPTLDPQPGVLGLIAIRGSLIPVCDPFSVYDTSDSGKRPSIAAVIIEEEQAIGLAVDGVHGLRRFKRSDIQNMHGETGRGLGAGTIQRKRRPDRSDRCRRAHQKRRIAARKDAAAQGQQRERSRR